MRSLIKDVLALNPHSVHMITKHNTPEQAPIWAVALDNCQIVYIVKSQLVEVKRILPLDVTGDTRLRTKEWLDKIKDYLTELN